MKQNNKKGIENRKVKITDKNREKFKQEEKYFDNLEKELRNKNMQVYKDLGIELRIAIVFGFEKGSLSKEKEMLDKFEKLIDEIGERFYYHSDIDGVDLKLNELEEYQEFKEERLQKLKGDEK